MTATPTISTQKASTAPAHRDKRQIVDEQILAENTELGLSQIAVVLFPKVTRRASTAHQTQDREKRFPRSFTERLTEPAAFQLECWAPDLCWLGDSLAP